MHQKNGGLVGPKIDAPDGRLVVDMDVSSLEGSVAAICPGVRTSKENVTAACARHLEVAWRNQLPIQRGFEDVSFPTGIQLNIFGFPMRFQFEDPARATDFDKYLSQVP